MVKRIYRMFFTIASIFGILHTPTMAFAAPSSITTYYVSSTVGSDNNDGLSQATPIATIGKVNTLNLQPGDRVLFRCGDVWRGEQLVLGKSGTESARIEFNSYPGGCVEKPAFSGSRPIGGWVLDSGSVYRADLSAADFPLGINQLFRAGTRLTLGRWPNLNAANGGYSFVDGHASGGNLITDNELPLVTWTGAIVHIKNIRWSMLDREVTGTNGHELTLNQGLSCLISGWADCVGWGFFINNHRNTLDQDGEWFYDKDARRVYLYSTSGSPTNIEGSVIQEDAATLRHGGIMLSNGAATSYITIDNLEVKNWFNHGIGTPGGMNNDIYHHITVKNVTIKDVDAAGVNLSSWLERPSDGRKGLRGGHDLVFLNNLIDGANAFGITGYFASSTFENNTIRNIALIKNLGKSGMSCGLTSSECTENGDGFRIRLYDVRDSGFGNSLRGNYFEKIGYNGVDVFGPETTLEKNFITQSCYSKADCGGVRVFGSDSLAATTVYNIHLLNNIIVDIPGNVEGCHPSRAAFGMGLYIDNYSRNVETSGNTIINTTISGILYQQSSGVVSDNLVFNASSGTEYSAQIDIGGSASQVTLNHNVMFGLNTSAWTLYTYALSNIVSSDWNYIFHPYISKHIAYGPSWTRQTFSQWQSLSGQDSHSKTNWYTQITGETSRARVFYNNTQTAQSFDLGDRQYLDLDQNPWIISLTLQPFTSKVLVDNGPAPLTLISIQPVLWGVNRAAGFNLTVKGLGFTPSSVIRWNGSNRPTTYISTNYLTAAISSNDVSSSGQFPITVWDPLPAPNGTETSSMMFKVIPTEYLVFMPKASR